LRNNHATRHQELLTKDLKDGTPQTIASISVIGAGTMGHGIAQVAAAAGYRDSLARGIRAIERNLEKGMQLGKLTEEDREQTLQNIHGTTQLEQVATADLVIEAAPEQLQLKQDLLRQTESFSDHNFIFASNTSSLSITEIASASARPERVVGMHFFNPVHVMRLLEIVVGESTAVETVEAVSEVGRRMRKEPIIVKDVPGFASSRLGVALGLEAMRMLEQGVASAKDIDKAMELGYNHPMGPLKLTDVVGLDVRLNIAEYLHGALGSETFRPPDVLRRLVSEGKLGKKSGEGFYSWREENGDARLAHSS
jgi:3-hydroxybutyryl-CoA dehydrogenase